MATNTNDHRPVPDGVIQARPQHPSNIGNR